MKKRFYYYSTLIIIQSLFVFTGCEEETELPNSSLKDSLELLAEKDSLDSLMDKDSVNKDTINSRDTVLSDTLNKVDTIEVQLPKPDSVLARITVTGTEAGEVDTLLVEPREGFGQVVLTFKNPQGKMERLYATESLNGQGDRPFDLEELLKRSVNGDGSVDIKSIGDVMDIFDSIVFDFELPIASTLIGSVVYKFWMTSSRGDFRDSTESATTKVATIKLFTGEDDPGMEIFDDVRSLSTPLLDGTSRTFLSTLGGYERKFNSSELTKFWDIGYIYLPTGKAGFHSPAKYPRVFQDQSSINNLVGLAELVGVPAEELNSTYFVIYSGSKSFSEFSNAQDLSTLEVSESDPQKITDLKVGDLVAFMDGYGKKGIIQVTKIVEGLGSDGQITFNIKAQR